MLLENMVYIVMVVGTMIQDFIRGHLVDEGRNIDLFENLRVRSLCSSDGEAK